jgi:hypothetical protein
MNTNNNQIIGELDVVVFPGELAYDDGSYSSTTWWIGGGGGFGVQFDPPVYPAEITMIRFFVGLSDSPPDSFRAMILDDDGPAGGPGTTLFQQTVVCNVDTSWYMVPTSITVNDGSFFVGWLMLVDSIAMGIDDTPPISRNTWELTGGWAPYRDQETSEAMIRCMIGEGAIPSPIIDVSADTIDFGTVFIGDSVSQELTVYNVGSSGDLVINNITITGPPPSLNIFQVYGFTPDTSIAPGDSMILTLYYRPMIPNVTSGTMNIASNSITGTATVQLYGTGALGVNGGNNVLPLKFELAQNQPNPFNPTTTIGYSIPTSGHVELVVFNINGAEIATLVDSEKSAGYYSVTFDGKDLSSGVYLYRLTCGNHTSMKKMVLMK